MTTLAANALTELATVKAELGETATDFDDYLTRLINAVSDAFESYCRRPFGYAAGLTENYAPNGGQSLLLVRTPVLSVASVTDLLSGNVVDPTQYSLENAASGKLWNSTGWVTSAATFVGTFPTPLPGSEQRSMQVVYTGGYVLPKDDGNPNPRTLPYDLEDACVSTVARRWRLKSEGDLDLAPVLRTLNKYRRPGR